jgi:hypothetical protein
MAALQDPRPTAQRAVQSKTLGAVALVLAIITALFALIMLGSAAALYATIFRATSISTGEGPSLTAAQEEVSSLVMNLKSAAILGSLLLGLTSFPLGFAAVGLSKGRALGIAALTVLAIATAGSLVLLLEAFPIDPCLSRITCGG